MRRKEMLVAVIGGVVGAVLAMAAASFAPLGAQTEVADVEFGTITCTRLNVVNSAGKTLVRLDNGGVDVVEDRNGEFSVVEHEHSGNISVYSKDGNRVHLSDSIMVWHSDFGGVSMSINEHGGRAYVLGKDGVIGDAGSVRIENDERGRKVRVLGKGKDHEREVKMRIDKYGGGVAVFGRGNNSSRAIMGVNEYGNGTVNTWDKNGYRLASLK